MKPLENQTVELTTPPAFWRAGLFWLAMLAGPVCWGLLALLRVPGQQSPLPTLQIVMIILAYPLVEEIVFRAGIQQALMTRPALSRSWANISLANLVTSLLFAAAHLVSQPALWAMLVIAPSMVFGWAYERYQTLVAPIVLHAFYNAGFIYLMQSA